MLTVTLQVKEIIFDIQNKTYLTGRSREAEAAKGFEAASYMQASDDVENSYQLRRSLNNAFADLKTTLAEYLTEKTTSTDNLVKDAIDKDGAINLELEMPNNFNPAAADNIGSALHQYIVNRAIFRCTEKSQFFRWCCQSTAQSHRSYPAWADRHISLQVQPPFSVNR